MIRVITGAPGSGKSFYAVKHLRDNYYSYDNESGKYIKKEGYTIISNLEGLKLEHINLDSVLLKSGVEIWEFFTVDYQKKVTAKYDKIVYVIDECQRYFDERMDRKYNCVYFFEYHRHLGIDFYLMTQTYERLSKKIRGLEENQIHAQRRISSIVGEFNYQVKSGKEIIDKKVLRKDKGIFKLYTSRQKKETEKVRNPMLKYLLIALIIMIACGYLFYRTFIKSFGKDEKKKINKVGEVESKKNEKRKDTKKIEVKKVKRIPLEVSFITDGRDIFIYDDDIKQLIPMEMISSDLIVIRNNGIVKKIYKYVSYDEALRLANMRAIERSLDREQAKERPNHKEEYNK